MHSQFIFYRVDFYKKKIDYENSCEKIHKLMKKNETIFLLVIHFLFNYVLENKNLSVCSKEKKLRLDVNLLKLIVKIMTHYFIS